MKKDIFEITNDTMETINKGYFINNKNEKIEIEKDMLFSISNTKVYKPDYQKDITILNDSCTIEVTNETSFAAIERLHLEKKIITLQY